MNLIQQLQLPFSEVLELKKSKEKKYRKNKKAQKVASIGVIVSLVVILVSLFRGLIHTVNSPVVVSDGIFIGIGVGFIFFIGSLFLFISLIEKAYKIADENAYEIKDEKDEKD